MSVSPLEQKRRDLKGGDPALYALISALESSKALDALGDQLSGRSVTTGMEAANMAWARASVYTKTYRVNAISV